MLVRTADELRTPEFDSRIRESTPMFRDASRNYPIHHCVIVGECYFASHVGTAFAVKESKSRDWAESQMLVIR